MAPLLYRYDSDTNTAEAQTEVGHFALANGPTWSADGSKFYFTSSSSFHIREYDYD